MRSLLSSLWSRRTHSTPRSCQVPVRCWRPHLEGLEDRLAPSASTLTAPALAPALAAPAVQQASPVLPLQITGVSIQNGQLVASGLLGSTPFSAPLTLAPSASSTTTTPVLDLHLDPIHLNLLGLKVDTSAICLNVSAQSGSGNLLGNLVGTIAHALDSGSSLSSILGGLTSTQTSTLTNGLTSLLNGALGAVTSSSSVTGATTGTTNVLHLSLGPVNLNLLGLTVKLDNCANGPVTVDVSAQSGPGNLLGNLIGDLAHLLDNGANLRAIQNVVNRIAREVRQDVAQAASLLPLQITNVSVQNGQLVASGTLGGTPFTAPLTVSTAASSTTATPVLDLHLDPIHLNLLGLHVDTSAICLNISAQPGSGNLLGNLVSDIAHALDTGSSLSSILSGLTSAQTSTLTNGLTSLLNSVLRDLTSFSSVTGATTGSATGSAAGTTTNILHLALGPVTLNLLGLNVKLDNCANGPVTVDVSAQSGPGNLLGNLLGDLAHLLDNGASLQAIEGELTQIAHAISQLVSHPTNLLSSEINDLVHLIQSGAGLPAIEQELTQIFNTIGQLV